jgi:hypothetical protein
MNLKHVMTLVAVMHCDVIKINQERELITQAEPFIINNTTIKKDDFLSLSFWFERTHNPSNEQEEYGISLKEVLYEINHDDNVIKNLNLGNY